MIAPALIGVPKKSVAGPLDEDRALQRAALMARGIDRVLPVFWAGRVLGWMTGVHPSLPDVMWCPARRAPPLSEYRLGWSTYRDLDANYRKSRKHPLAWRKAATTAGIANTWYDLWPVGTNPAVGAYGGAAFTAVQKTEATTGSLFHGGDQTSVTKHLAWVQANPSAGVPSLLIYDRVLTYEACTFTTSNQAFTNGVAAQRWISTGDPGLKVCLTCQTALGATAANLTQFQYTDNEGNATQSMPTTVTVSHIVSAAAPTSTLGARVVCPATSGAALAWGPFLPLAVGDTGARLVANWTWSAAQTGTICVVLMYPQTYLPLPVAAVDIVVDQIVQTTQLSRIINGACLSFLLFKPATTALSMYGEGEVVWA